MLTTAGVTNSPLATIFMAVVSTALCPFFVYPAAKNYPSLGNVFKETFAFILVFFESAASNILNLPWAFPLPVWVEVLWLLGFLGTNTLAFQRGKKKYHAVARENLETEQAANINE